MLYADKAALENRTKVKLLAIRERELNLYTTNCRTVGNVSALMAGIAYTALIYTKMAYFQESHVVQQLLYITGLVICMCLSLRNVLGTTLLTMLGPGKALRGPDGSMHAAVDGMKDAFETIATIQHLTIYSFMATTLVYSWGAASMAWWCSVMLSVTIIAVTQSMIARTRTVEGTFPLRSIELVSGAFFPSGSNAAGGGAESAGGGAGGGGRGAARPDGYAPLAGEDPRALPGSAPLPAPTGSASERAAAQQRLEHWQRNQQQLRREEQASEPPQEQTGQRRRQPALSRGNGQPPGASGPAELM